jgi:hypothetical protein
MFGGTMFWPHSNAAVLAACLLLGTTGLADAQSAPVAAIDVSGAKVVPTKPTNNALFAEISAEAGIPYIPTPPASGARVAADTPTPPLCIRAGVGVAIPVLNTPVMTMEHGILGCPTNTDGLPFVLTKDPDLQAPPNSRTGDYNLDVTVRYRLLQTKHIVVMANASAQAIGYSLDEPLTGNNVMVSVSLIF